MDFLDFQISAWWTDQNHVQVMVHSSPVGGMRHPVSVPARKVQLERFRATFRERGKWRSSEGGELAALGRHIAQVLLNPQVYSMLLRSLEHVVRDNGLRIRLCLDESLIDLPWEYLYRPDAPDPESLGGFLILDPRISLVREAPNLSLKLKPSQKSQRLVFAAAFRPSGEDIYETEKEYTLLSKALEKLKDLVTIDYRDASADHIDKALTTNTAVFHYAGHTNVFGGKGYLEREAAANETQRLYSQSLANSFVRAKTRLGVFNACNSGQWEFMEPLIHAGLPAAIGIQGLISNRAAIAFCEKLYSALAIGLSLDESVTWARLHLLEPGILSEDETFAWGTFMVYMPAADAVIFPRPRSKEIRNKQEAVRSKRQQTIINVYQNIGTVLGGQVTGVSGLL
jgi:hypothetical protein